MVWEPTWHKSALSMRPCLRCFYITEQLSMPPLGCHQQNVCWGESWSYPCIEFSLLLLMMETMWWKPGYVNNSSKHGTDLMQRKRPGFPESPHWTGCSSAATPEKQTPHFLVTASASAKAVRSSYIPAIRWFPLDTSRLKKVQCPSDADHTQDAVLPCALLSSSCFLHPAQHPVTPQGRPTRLHTLLAHFQDYLTSFHT